MKRLAILLALVFNFPSLAISETALQYRVTEIGVLPGAESSVAFGINDLGQVVGVSGSGANPSGSRAFLWDSRQGMINLGTTPGADFSTANAINNRGEVVGYSGGPFYWSPTTGIKTIPAGEYSSATDINDDGQVVGWIGASAFIWNSTDGLTDLRARLGIPLSRPVAANSINNLGQIAGTIQSFSSSDEVRAFYFDETPAMELGPTPNGTKSFGLSINDHGQIAGYGPTPDGYRAFLWEPATGMTPLGMLPTLFRSDTNALAINNLGQIVGISSGRPYVWDRATGFTNLQESLTSDSPRINLFQPRGINNVGQIVGSGGSFTQGGERAFVLTPIPEPASIILAAVGLVAAAAISVSHPLRFRRQTRQIDPPVDRPEKPI